MAWAVEALNQQLLQWEQVYSTIRFHLSLAFTLENGILMPAMIVSYLPINGTGGLGVVAETSSLSSWLTARMVPQIMPQHR